MNILSSYAPPPHSRQQWWMVFVRIFLLFVISPEALEQRSSSTNQIVEDGELFESSPIFTNPNEREISLCFEMIIPKPTKTEISTLPLTDQKRSKWMKMDVYG